MYKRIKELREDNDYKQIDLAKYLDCSQVCYSYYETGKRDVPTDILIKLSKFYRVSVDYILELSDIK